MRKNRSNLMLSLGIMLLAALACKFGVSTANISGLKIGKDKNVSKETSSFGTSDTVYAIAEISNAPDKLKVKGRLAVDDVEGQEKGPIPGLEDTVDLTGSGTAIFTFTPPASGWPKGTYRLEVLMLNPDGEQKDQKTVSFTVS